MRNSLLTLLLTMIITSATVMIAEHSEATQIAFILVEGETTYLATVDTQGHNLRRVTPCVNICRDPVWSADGHRLGFVDRNALVTTEINTGETDRFPVDLGTYDYNVHPAWSPDLSTTIHAARVNMTSLLRITDLLHHDTRAIEDLPVNPSFPFWINQGKGFLFSANGIIYHYDLKQQTATALTPPDQQFDLPTPSPNETEIILRRPSSEDPGLSLFSHATGDIQPILSGVVDAVRWSHDGQHIAFSLWDDGKLTLRVLTLETGETLTLTNNVVSGAVIDWSPNSDKIAYIGLSTDQPQFNNLFTVNITSKQQPELIVENISRAGSPAVGIAWQPGGNNP